MGVVSVQIPRLVRRRRVLNDPDERVVVERRRRRKSIVVVVTMMIVARMRRMIKSVRDDGRNINQVNPPPAKNVVVAGKTRIQTTPNHHHLYPPPHLRKADPKKDADPKNPPPPNGRKPMTMRFTKVLVLTKTMVVVTTRITPQLTTTNGVRKSTRNHIHVAAVPNDGRNVVVAVDTTATRRIPPTLTHHPSPPTVGDIEDVVVIKKHSSSSHSKKKKNDRHTKEKEPTTMELKKKSVIPTFGMYGIMKQSDIHQSTKAKLSVEKWMAEIKGVPEGSSVAKWEMTEYFKEYVEDFNTATLPHQKYYDYGKWEMEEYNKKKGEAQSKKGPISDEFLHVEEMRRDAMEKKRTEMKLVISTMNHGKVKEMKRQAELKAELENAYRVGDQTKVKQIKRRLEPDEKIH